MDITLKTLTPGTIEELQREAGVLGLTLEAMCEMILIHEATRLWHIERSRPRPSKPLVSAEVNNLALMLREVISKKLSIIGPTWDNEARRILDAIDVAIADNNLDALRRIEMDKPWNKKKW